MDIQISEQRLPGIGHRYEMAIDPQRSLIVVVHDQGRRGLAVATRGAESPDLALSLTQDQAVALAALLIGARISIDTAEDRIAAGEPAAETLTLQPSSPAAGGPPDQTPVAAEPERSDFAACRSSRPAEA